MQILGIDFTSAPRAAKPIACAVCELHGTTLAVQELRFWQDFGEFEAFLAQPGPWLAAVDFPLGQPRRLVERLDWPCEWEKYTSLVGKMTKQAFVTLIDEYRALQPAGDKHHFRLTDQMAGACSPMMLYGVPVGKMFFEGAPRVERSGASVWPCRPNSSGRIVVEGYPALVVRHLMGKTPYKSDKSKQSSQRDHRCQIVEKCQSPGQLRDYGMSLRFSAELEIGLIEDSTGDSLDAVLCAIQAAAYWLQPSEQCTNLAEANATEGWIVDPTYANDS